MAALALLSGCGSGVSSSGVDAILAADSGSAVPGGEDARAASDLDDPDQGPIGITPGQALGKFCHELYRSGQAIELTIEFGDPAITRVTSRTGVCAPPAGTPCHPIPVGEVPLRLLEGDRVLVTRSVVLGDGNEYVFQPVITSSLQVVIAGGKLTAGTCSGLDFPAADGGIPSDAMGAEAGLARD